MARYEFDRMVNHRGSVISPMTEMTFGLDSLLEALPETLLFKIAWRPGELRDRAVVRVRIEDGGIYRPVFNASHTALLEIPVPGGNFCDAIGSTMCSSNVFSYYDGSKWVVFSIPLIGNVISYEYDID